METQEIRFRSLQRLYGKTAFEKLARAHVCVVGLGGVGSWAVEALARSGIGSLTLVDLDEICESNVNRQIHALDGQFGKSKARALAERSLLINPRLDVHVIEEFFDKNNAERLLATPYDYVIDAIDGLGNKCLLADHCLQRKIPLIITGGAAGKTDPALIRVCDLGLSREDMLLMRMRKKLRRQYGFQKGKKTLFGISCVYSEERAVYPTLEGEVCVQKAEGAQLKLDCENGPGSATFITGTYAFFAVSHVVGQLVKA